MTTEAQWQTLHRYVRDALAQHPPDLAADLAKYIDAGRWRVIATFDTDAQGEPIPASLYYRFDINLTDGWAPLARIHWSRMPDVGTDTILREVANVKAQQEMGISPDSWSVG